VRRPPSFTRELGSLPPERAPCVTPPKENREETRWVNPTPFDTVKLLSELRNQIHGTNSATLSQTHGSGLPTQLSAIRNGPELRRIEIGTVVLRGS
jgi:hypothetical protein